MYLTIHRGAKEVGGSCVEISNEQTKILIDFGLPLSDNNGNSLNINKIIQSDINNLLKQGILPDIRGLYKTEDPEISAIFISHAHPDHFGLLNFVHPSITIYCSEITKSIILDVYPYLYRFNYNLPNFVVTNNLKIVEIDELSVKPYDVDHSIPASQAFEIFSENINILYTGDIRSHGRKSYLLKSILKNINKTDYLLLEGTNIGRERSSILSEEDLEEKLFQHFKSEKLNITIFSAQNLDRFISIYKACLRSKKTLVIDPYTAYILEIFKPLSKNIPQFNWNNIKIFFLRIKLLKN
jgi:ribonuclease J